MSLLEAACHLHEVAVLTGGITCCISMSCFIQSTGYMVFKEGSRGLLFFFGYCKMRACFICLLPAKQDLQAIHHYSLSCGVLKMLAATVAL